MIGIWYFWPLRHLIIVMTWTVQHRDPVPNCYGQNRHVHSITLFYVWIFFIWEEHRFNYFAIFSHKVWQVTWHRNSHKDASSVNLIFHVFSGVPPKHWRGVRDGVLGRDQPGVDRSLWSLKYLWVFPATGIGWIVFNEYTQVWEYFGTGAYVRCVSSLSLHFLAKLLNFSTKIHAVKKRQNWRKLQNHMKL